MYSTNIYSLLAMNQAVFSVPDETKLIALMEIAVHIQKSCLVKKPLELGGVFILHTHRATNHITIGISGTAWSYEMCNYDLNLEGLGFSGVQKPKDDGPERGQCYMQRYQQSFS